MDSNISILQYIKNGNISINNEISKIKAGKDSNIIVKQFFIKSIDYETLTDEIKIKIDLLDTAINSFKKKHISKELNNLLILEKEFKIDILLLANTFSKLEIRTERLRKAKKLFELGKFREADAILVESELSNEQFNLLIQIDYLEQKEKEHKITFTK